MKLRVQYSAQLRAAAGRPHDELDMPDGSSLAALLDRVVGLLDEAARMHLIGPGGGIRSSLLVVVNDAAAPVHAAASTDLKHGDVILLLPPIAGG
jgi:molybdopterin converting factor small subunit